MTGYGKGVGSTESINVIVEIRSLNSKQLDINLRLPQNLKFKEIELRNAVGSVLKRGKVDVSILVEQSTAESASVLNLEMAKHYFYELEQLAAVTGQNSIDYIPIIVKMPDVFIAKTSEISDDDVAVIVQSLNDAITGVDAFREKEGAVLEKDIKSRVETILVLLDSVDKFENQRIVNIKERIKNNVSKFVKDPETDKNRLEQEIIYYIEKLDITEEKVRLLNNCNYFLETLNNSTSSGKKLGFISQEIGREINTLGSKANDSNLQKIVVLMKDELEKIKEQLFNIL